MVWCLAVYCRRRRRRRLRSLRETIRSNDLKTRKLSEELGERECGNESEKRRNVGESFGSARRVDAIFRR